jgi:DNA-binding response OmpR family regulator
MMLDQFPPSILLVEDDRATRNMLAEWLEVAGYSVVAVPDGQQALQSFKSQPSSLVVLDLLLPGTDGWTVCRDLRASSNVPILVVSGLSDEANQVKALELGADDYLVKPVSGRVLLARIKALLRRAGLTDAPIAYGPIRLDPQTHTAWVFGRSVTLTPHETALIEALMRQPQRTFSRAELLEKCWEVGFEGVDRVVDVHIAGLRRKLGDGRLIRTIRGRGYRMGHED